MHTFGKKVTSFTFGVCAVGLLLTAFRPAGYPGETLSFFWTDVATLIGEASVDEQGAVTIAEMNTNGPVTASNYHSRRMVLHSSPQTCV